MTTWLLVLAKKLAHHIGMMTGIQLGAGERKSGCQGGACRKEEDEGEDAFVGVGVTPWEDSLVIQYHWSYSIWPKRTVGPVRSEPVQNPFDTMLGPLNREPDHRSGSSQGMNLGPNHGQVRLGSELNNLTIPN